MASSSATTNAHNSTSPRSRNMSSASSSRRAATTGLVPRLQAFLLALLWPFLSLLRFLLTGRLSGTGDDFDGLSAAVTAKASQNFVDYLRSFQQQQQIANNNGSSSSNGGNNNNDHQAWLTTGFAAAQEQATQQQSLLLVYLHSPLHRSSESFCKQVLCHEQMTNIINQPNITAFGVSIHTAQGAYLAKMLQASSYPFLALLQPKVSTTTTPTNNSNGSNNNTPSNSSSSSSAMTLLLRAEGPALVELSVHQLLPHFQTALQRHQMAVAEAEARRLQRQEEQALRQQQDEEYQAALLADQERERTQREQAQQEAERVQAAQAAQEQVEANAAAALETARSQVPVEPPVSSGSTGVTTIRFVLPSGVKLNRRFDSNDRISGLLAYLKVYVHDHKVDMSTDNLGLSTNFPKQSYHDDPTQTLEEAGLAPQAVLMVQDLDA